MVGPAPSLGPQPGLTRRAARLQDPFDPIFVWPESQKTISVDPGRCGGVV